MALRVYAFAVQALFFKLLKFIQGMIDQYWFQSFFFYIVWFSIFSRGNIFFSGFNQPVFVSGFAGFAVKSHNFSKV